MHSTNRLDNKTIQSLPAGKYCDGAGLWIAKRKDGGSQWFIRYTLHGQRLEMGLGGYPKVTLKQARIDAGKWREVVAAGKNPLDEKKRIITENQQAKPTFALMMGDALEALKRELVGDGKAGRWDSPLRLHVIPKLGKTLIEDIDQNTIKRVLAPIWHDKPATARKALSRISIVMKHAAAAGYDVDIQATEKAKLLLGKQTDKTKHIPALNWREVPSFYQSLDGGTVTELALKLLILTTLRSKPIRFLRLEYIEGDILTVPPDLVKGTKAKRTAFRVPLSLEALDVIEQAKKFERGGFLFPNVNKGVLSDATMIRFMDRMGLEARPHGFRSSFRTWCEETDKPWNVAETTLGHVIGGNVERSYQRSDLLEKRRVIMSQWSNHLSGQFTAAAQLITLQRETN